ncbi:Exostosin-like, partial [Trema orientale]
ELNCGFPGGLPSKLLGGRVSWDFRRQTEEQSEWGSKLMSLPESKNMTLLTIEASSYDNDFAIPYPKYFHPAKDSQVFDWQRRMRASKRPYLFSFAGAPRPHLDDSIRGEIIAQCRSSGKLCKLLSCYAGPSSTNFCEEPLNVMKVFERSVFCLQPTRISGLKLIWIGLRVLELVSGKFGTRKPFVL